MSEERYKNERTAIEWALRDACTAHYKYADGRVKILNGKDGNTVCEDIIANLKKRYPDDAYIVLPSEEDLSGLRTWIIETVNRAGSDTEICAAQCALYEDGECVASAIYLTSENFMLSASKGGHAFVNDKPLKKKETPSEEDLNVWVKPSDIDGKKPQKAFYEALGRLDGVFKSTVSGRHSCVDFVCLADGLTDALILTECAPSVTADACDVVCPYSDMPGTLILREAGCVIREEDVMGMRVKIFTVNENLCERIENALKCPHADTF